jgi:hypothetical protein
LHPDLRSAEDRVWNTFGAPPLRERRVRLPALDLEVRAVELGSGPPNAGAIWAPIAAKLDGFARIVVDLVR